MSVRSVLGKFFRIFMAVVMVVTLQVCIPRTAFAGETGEGREGSQALTTGSQDAPDELAEGVVIEEEVVEEETITLPDILDEPEVLLNDYIGVLTAEVAESYASVSNEAMSNVIVSNERGSKLTGAEKNAYDFLRSFIADVAAGSEEIEMTEIALNFNQVFPEDVLAAKYTAEDLGVESIVIFDPETGQPTGIAEDAKTATAAQYNLDLQQVINALLFDCPYELFWYEKTAGVDCDRDATVSASYEGGKWVAYCDPGESAFTFYFAVSDDYAPSSFYQHIFNGVEKPIQTDRAKIQSIQTAVAKAAGIVEDAAATEESDYDKLVYYKDQICGAVVYDEYASEKENNVPYGDPWQLISVFDDNDDTNVVCEGYSKAFKYLCDLTDFEDGSLDCYTVTGEMDGGTGAGPHMWNVAIVGGNNYLVDVTNCDEGTIGAPSELFLKGNDSPEETTVEGFDSLLYTFAPNGGQVTYVYDADTVQSFALSELTLATSDYEEPDPEEDNTITVVNGVATVDGVEVTTAEPGTTVALTAVAPTGYDSATFKHWSISSEAQAPTTETTTFTMPEGNVTAIARYEVWLDDTTDDSEATVIGKLVMSDRSFSPAEVVFDGEVYHETSSVGYSAGPADETIASMITAAQDSINAKASEIAYGDDEYRVTDTTNETSQDCDPWDHRKYQSGYFDADGNDVGEGGNWALYSHTATGSYGKKTTYTTTVTADFEGPLTHIITNMDIGNVWTALSPVQGIAFTTAFDPDGVLDGQMEFVDQWWKDTSTGEEIHIGSDTLPALGDTYEFGVKISPKEGYCFNDEPFIEFIYGGTPVPEGDYTKTLNLDGSLTLTWGLRATCEPESLNNEDLNTTVTGITNKTYNGKAQTQKPTVKVILREEEQTLVEGTDYTLSYKNNTNAGTATVTITGKGNYKDSISKTFTIAKAKVAIPTAKTGLVFNGSAQTGVAAGTNYTIATGSATKAGSYTATATLKDVNNYMWADSTTAAKKIAWSIASASIAKATVTGVVDKPYVGKAITQSPVVKLGTTTLKLGTDYALSYKNNTNVGTATVTITGKGNYKDSASKTFKITEATPGNAASGVTGWNKNKTGWWYKNADGTVSKAKWQKIDNKWYHFAGTGYMQTGWLKDGGKWYYLNGSGVMLTGWQKIGGDWYFLDKSSGAMATGWLQDGSKWYFLDKTSGKMAWGEWREGYWLNNDGTWTYKPKASWKKDSKGWLFGDTSGWYAKSTDQWIDGKKYNFNGAGYCTNP